ncbi:MAG: hypothetical protein ACQEXJ_21085 [Myxococcota bacterium]
MQRLRWADDHRSPLALRFLEQELGKALGGYAARADGTVSYGACAFGSQVECLDEDLGASGIEGICSRTGIFKNSSRPEARRASRGSEIGEALDHVLDAATGPEGLGLVMTDGFYRPAGERETKVDCTRVQSPLVAGVYPTERLLRGMSEGDRSFAAIVFRKVTYSGSYQPCRAKNPERPGQVPLVLFAWGPDSDRFEAFIASILERAARFEPTAFQVTPRLRGGSELARSVSVRSWWRSPGDRADARRLDDCVSANPSLCRLPRKWEPSVERNLVLALESAEQEAPAAWSVWRPAVSWPERRLFLGSPGGRFSGFLSREASLFSSVTGAFETISDADGDDDGPLGHRRCPTVQKLTEEWETERGQHEDARPAHWVAARVSSVAGSKRGYSCDRLKRRLESQLDCTEELGGAPAATDNGRGRPDPVVFVPEGCLPDVGPREPLLDVYVASSPHVLEGAELDRALSEATRDFAGDTNPGPGSIHGLRQLLGKLARGVHRDSVAELESHEGPNRLGHIRIQP